MKVSEFEDFDQFETEGLLTGSRERSWIWFGLVVSLAIHFALCAYFYRTRFAPTEAVFAPNDQTPTFKVRSITDSNLDKSADQETHHLIEKAIAFELQDSDVGFARDSHLVQRSNGGGNRFSAVCREARKIVGANEKLRSFS